MSRLVLADLSGGVGTLTLNRPERHNSLVPELLREALTTLETGENHADLRALVLQANGRSFSTGGDVRAFYEHRGEIAAYAREIVGLLNEMILALLDLPIPVVAAVHGIVTGGSLGFLLASDVVLVSPEAGITPYYGKVGFSPDGGWTALLPQIIGGKRAGEVLLRNETISAEQAVEWGLASRVVPGERIRDEAYAVAEEIAQMHAGSVNHMKALLRHQYSDAAVRLEAEHRHFVAQITTEEARRGMEEFLGEAEDA